MSSLVNVLQKVFRGEKRSKATPALARFDGCPKCGSMKLSYDSYWNESCCQECGWIVQGEKADKKERPLPATQLTETPKSREKEAATDNLKFSYSKISLFKICPKAYHFKYVLKKDELFSTIEQHLGKALHSTLRHAYAIKDDGINISLTSLIKAFDQAWNSPEGERVKVIKNNMTSRDYYLEGQDMLKKYYHRVFKRGQA